MTDLPIQSASCFIALDSLYPDGGKAGAGESVGSCAAWIGIGFNVSSMRSYTGMIRSTMNGMKVTSWSRGSAT